MRPVGEIELTDLAALCRLAGHDGLPYPFARSGALDDSSERRSSVAERVQNGDLAEFRDWADAYVAADIWLAGRIHHSDPRIADGRILGFRCGDNGYLACQRSDDVVEIFSLPADDLGAECADLVEPAAPGTHPRIVVRGYVGYFAPSTDAQITEDEDAGVASVLTAVNRPASPKHQKVADDDVAAIAIIQSRCQPARDWGVDWTKPIIACLYIEGDGSYVYVPDFSYAVPVVVPALADRIDRLIADSLADLAYQRGIDF
ncbi:ESX secretion-associated protein EspG [Mycobacterium sp. LTG2003]